MRQVPANYLIIGRGRLGLHLASYFSLAEVACAQWGRDNSKDQLKTLIENAKYVLLAIKDDAIESFIKENNIPVEKAVHFSGSLSTTLATRLHPLMTFSNTMYSLADYQKIPFVGEFGARSFKDIFPTLANPYFEIPKGSQDLYHALCVLSGNGTVVLWQNVFKTFEERLNLPKEVLLPYLERVTKNIASDANNALTGPWVRNDLSTISKNQNALKNTKLSSLYNSLFDTYTSVRNSVAEINRSFL